MTCGDTSVEETGDIPDRAPGPHAEPKIMGQAAAAASPPRCAVCDLFRFVWCPQPPPQQLLDKGANVNAQGGDDSDADNVRLLAAASLWNLPELRGPRLIWRPPQYCVHRYIHHVRDFQLASLIEGPSAMECETACDSRPLISIPYGIVESHCVVALLGQGLGRSTM
jgi:hypothetical protein